MSLFRRAVKIQPPVTTDDDGDRPAYGDSPAIDKGIPIGVYAGRVPNPHILYGQDDLETGPVTFARYNMSRGMHDVQLSNGWQYTGYGRICNYRNEGYLAVVQPEIPGQSRLFGAYGPPAGFVPRGNSPGQWQNIVNQVGQAPSNPGGPGQYMGKIVANGSGG
jgi:hypothetical protein